MYSPGDVTGAFGWIQKGHVPQVSGCRPHNFPRIQNLGTTAVLPWLNRKVGFVGSGITFVFVDGTAARANS